MRTGRRSCSDRKLIMSADPDPLDTLEALAQTLEDVPNVAGAAVHKDNPPWIELITARPLRPAVLRDIADHNCGIDETAVNDGLLMVTVRFIAPESET